MTDLDRDLGLLDFHCHSRPVLQAVKRDFKAHTCERRARRAGRGVFFFFFISLKPRVE